MSKLTSRKLWVSIAAMLASIATSIAGLQTGNTVVATVGIVCGIVSAAIYAFCEAWVDAASAKNANMYVEVADEEEDK